jgi:acyl-CoA thioesterase-1
MTHAASHLFACLLLACAFLGCQSDPVAEKDTGQAAKTAKAQTLPKVLLIGDSISQGYRRVVVDELKGEAEVSRIPGNGEWTGTGVQKVDQWLGDTDWDVIHFNFGLWDMYGWPYYDKDRSPKAYAQRLEQIIARLKKTDATLIWATTTPPCPENEVSMRDRFKKPGIVTVEVEREYLDAAERVMRKHGIQINDLNALVRDDIATLHTGPDNVHFTGEGNSLLGKQVADAIREAIDSR